jgi:4-diphosphocytidyl-2-C-methyl-D-erythritol kinase
MTKTDVFAPAKINLCLHVTGQRADGYHLLDSLVMFADVGDCLSILPADEMSLTVTGPRAEGVPADARNLCWKAAEAFGATAAITLEKHLPAAAGIGGGSSDAAAVLTGLARATGRAFEGDAAALGADVPVCQMARAARMSGIGEEVTALDMPKLHAVLVNPGVEVSTPKIFKRLTQKSNPPMTGLPHSPDTEALTAWLATQRNDLEPPAVALAPVIGTVLDALRAEPGVTLARMSGSGATCFARCGDAEAASRVALAISDAHPDWWVRATVLS